MENKCITCCTVCDCKKKLWQNPLLIERVINECISTGVIVT